MRTGGVIAAACLGLVLLAVVDAAQALDCRAPAEAGACTTNADCRCGTNGVTGECVVGVEACVGAVGACDRFCAAFQDVVPVCRDGRCTRARRTGCASDCDADARVDVGEMVAAVGVSLAARPLATCLAADVDGDHHATPAELVTGVRAGLESCAAVADEGSDERVLYDATVNFSPPYGDAEALGVIDGGSSDRSLALYTAPNAVLNVSLAAGGTEDTFDLDGFYIVTDYGFSVSGTAQVDDTEVAETIRGTLAPVHFEVPTGFTMRRSKSVSAARFSGAYAFSFTPSPSGRLVDSRVVSTLDVGARGSALSSDGADLDDGGGRSGTVSSSNCTIAPEGHLYCWGLYFIDASGLVNALRLTGVLTQSEAGAVSGSGSFLAGYDPPFGPEPYVPGSWTAVRLD